MNKAIIPSLLRKLEEEEDGDYSIFVKPKSTQAMELRQQSVRKKNLLKFKDHVDRLIIRSNERIKNNLPSEVIVTGIMN